MALISTSPRWNINWVDVWKSLRTGLVALVGAFVSGVAGVAPTLDIMNGDPQAILKSLAFGGIIAVLELARRWASDQAPQA